MTVLSPLFFSVFTLGTLFNYLVVSGPILAIALIAIGALMLIGGKSKA
ncbi:hypothetical protein LJK87_13775 [Paenibacillus sp. P25]|nr:hypothetical protein LJK87_13775 [Paenibacillus sp. P25]